MIILVLYYRHRFGSQSLMKEMHRVSFNTIFARDRERYDRIKVGQFSAFVCHGRASRRNRVCQESEYASCWAEAAKQKRRWEARGHTWWPSGCTWTPPPPHKDMDISRMSFRRSSHTRVSRASTSGISRFFKQSRRKQSVRIRKCMCLPSNYALVEFPVVWSELRSVIIMRCCNQGSPSSPIKRGEDY